MITQAEKEKTERANHYEEVLEQLNKKVAICEYSIKMAVNTGNPEVKEIQKKQEEEIKGLKSHIESTTKHATDSEASFVKSIATITKAVNEKVAEYEEKIEGWNTGERKVDRAEMVALADKLVREKISTSFVQGEYDTEEVVAS